MAEGASFVGAAWPAAPRLTPPPLTLPLPFPPFRPETEKTDKAGEIPRADFIGPRNDTKESLAGAARNDNATCEADADLRARLAARRRRAYNREYMRAWRRRNLEHYRTKNREYQRRTAQRRKLRRIAQAAASAETLCSFGCGRPATETIERVDPRTWKTFSVPYCGKC